VDFWFFFGSRRTAAMPKPSMVATMAMACVGAPSEESMTTFIKYWPAGNAAHHSTATMMYIFCLTVDGLEVGFSLAFGQAGGVVGW